MNTAIADGYDLGWKGDLHVAQADPRRAWAWFAGGRRVGLSLP
jgi:hypothetical protein